MQRPQPSATPTLSTITWHKRECCPTQAGALDCKRHRGGTSDQQSSRQRPRTYAPPAHAAPRSLIPRRETRRAPTAHKAVPESALPHGRRGEDGPSDAGRPARGAREKNHLARRAAAERDVKSGRPRRPDRRLRRVARRKRAAQARAARGAGDAVDTAAPGRDPGLAGAAPAQADPTPVNVSGRGQPVALRRGKDRAELLRGQVPRGPQEGFRAARRAGRQAPRPARRGRRAERRQRAPQSRARGVAAAGAAGRGGERLRAPTRGAPRPRRGLRGARRRDGRHDRSAARAAAPGLS